MSVGKPCSEHYGTLEALRQLAAVRNEGRPMKHFGAQLEFNRLDVLPGGQAVGPRQPRRLG